MKHTNSILRLIFLPNAIKIDPYDFELYRFKVGAFFKTLTHSVCFYAADINSILFVRCRSNSGTALGMKIYRPRGNFVIEYKLAKTNVWITILKVALLNGNSMIRRYARRWVTVSDR